MLDTYHAEIEWDDEIFRQLIKVNPLPANSARQTNPVVDARRLLHEVRSVAFCHRVEEPRIYYCEWRVQYKMATVVAGKAQGDALSWGLAATLRSTLAEMDPEPLEDAVFALESIARARTPDPRRPDGIEYTGLAGGSATAFSFDRDPGEDSNNVRDHTGVVWVKFRKWERRGTIRFRKMGSLRAIRAE